MRDADKPDFGTPPAGSWLLDPQYVLRVPVRPQDIDDFKHVNNVVYLGWMARCAWAHSKHLGFDFAAFQARDSGFVVTRHEIDYRAAAGPEDVVLVGTWISGNDGRLALTRRFQLIAEADGRSLAFGMTRFANMKLSTGRAARMPADYATGYPIDAAAAAHFKDHQTARR